MLNIKKAHESKILDFHSYFLNEGNQDEYSSEPEEHGTTDVSSKIQNLVDGKLKFIEVSPNDGRNKKVLSFDDLRDQEGGDKNEEVIFYLENDESLFIDFSWSYDYKAGMKSNDRDNPDDPDEYTLSDFQVETINFYSGDGDEHPIEITPKINDLLKSYFEDYLPITK